ncbi:MAG: PLP-dependent aminotransferase family protein [Synergistales bacterium]
MDLREHFNRKTGRIGSSIIAEMAGMVGPDGISFTSGEPSSDLIPLVELDASFRRVLGKAELFSYPSTAGYLPLREWIVEWMSRENLAPSWLDPSCLILTNGSQGAVNLLAETFIDPGDIILTESPTYPEALLAFRREGASILPIPIDSEGPIPEELEERLSGNRVKFLYTVVNFQNPSGCTTSDRRKAAILDLARRHGFFILEDDPYRYLRFEGSPTRSYFEMAGEDRRVIYLGSFSKIVAPGMRCGWCAFPACLRNKLLEVRLSIELCSPALTQAAVFEFLRGCDLKKHIEGLAFAYRIRRDALVGALESEASGLGLRLSVPEGGFFLWGTCEGIRDMLAFARYAAIEKKVGFIPGRFFYPNEGTGEESIRFAFAKVSPEQSRDGAARFKEALRSHLGCQPS